VHQIAEERRALLLERGLERHADRHRVLSDRLLDDALQELAVRGRDGGGGRIVAVGRGGFLSSVARRGGKRRGAQLRLGHREDGERVGEHGARRVVVVGGAVDAEAGCPRRCRNAVSTFCTMSACTANLASSDIIAEERLVHAEARRDMLSPRWKTWLLALAAC
jgi:hypothetical protein